MATTADPCGNPSDPMFSPCYTSHHARLILPPFTLSDHNARKEHNHHVSLVPSPQVDDEVEGEETLPMARPWNLRSRRGFRLPFEKRENERAQFSVSLTAEEIEEDVYAVTGSRPRRRPKRRPRVFQHQLDLSLLKDIMQEGNNKPQNDNEIGFFSNMIPGYCSGKMILFIVDFQTFVFPSVMTLIFRHGCSGMMKIL